jgi:guanylate kinase
MVFQTIPTGRSLLDYIDGHKMTEENQAAIQRAQDEMEQIEKRVIKTEQDVQQVTESVKEREINVSLSICSSIHSFSSFRQPIFVLVLIYV